MKMVITIRSFVLLIFLLSISSTYCFADATMEMGFCTSQSAAVTVFAARGANFLGVTATLSNGDYYDFPAKDVSQLTPYSFSLPSQYRARSWEARLWKKKNNSSKPWSDRVVNYQGYVMEKPVGVSVSCSP